MKCVKTFSHNCPVIEDGNGRGLLNFRDVTALLISDLVYKNNKIEISSIKVFSVNETYISMIG